MKGLGIEQSGLLEEKRGGVSRVCDFARDSED